MSPSFFRPTYTRFKLMAPSTSPHTHAKKCRYPSEEGRRLKNRIEYGSPLGSGGNVASDCSGSSQPTMPWSAPSTAWPFTPIAAIQISDPSGYLADLLQSRYEPFGTAGTPLLLSACLLLSQVQGFATHLRVRYMVGQPQFQPAPKPGDRL